MVRAAPDGPPRSEGRSAPVEALEAPALTARAPERDGKAREPDHEPCGVQAIDALYQPYFEQIKNTLDLHIGFVLLPVEVPSIDVGVALCRWLEREGAAVRIIETEKGRWRALGASLLALPAHEKSLVVVLGPREDPEDLAAGLNIFNLRRDTIAGHLGRPLLWCGLRSFLDVTLQNAPDFWSIREITVRIPLLAPREAPRVEGRGPWMEPMSPPASLVDQVAAARAANDEPNLARALLRLSRAQIARGRAGEGGEALAEAEALILRLPSFRRTVEEALAEDTRGDLTWVTSEAPAAEPAYTRALIAYEIIADEHGGARVMSKLGDVASWRGAFAEAARWYERAVATSEKLGDEWLQGVALYGRGTLRRKNNDMEGAAQDLDATLQIFRRLGNRADEASALRLRGYLRQDRGDYTGARDDYAAAAALSEAVGDAAWREEVLLEHGLPIPFPCS